MEDKVIKEKVVECMNYLGIVNFEDDINFNVGDYITDSIMFVSFIIELEQMFNIEIPDEYLVVDRLQTFDDICHMVELITEKNTDDAIFTCS